MLLHKNTVQFPSLHSSSCSSLFSPCVFLLDSEDKFFVLPKEKCSDCEQLKVFKEVLLSSEALKPKLDRCLKVSYCLIVASSFKRRAKPTLFSCVPALYSPGTGSMTSCKLCQ